MVQLVPTGPIVPGDVADEAAEKATGVADFLNPTKAGPEELERSAREDPGPLSELLLASDRRAGGPPPVLQDDGVDTAGLLGDASPTGNDVPLFESQEGSSLPSFAPENSPALSGLILAVIVAGIAVALGQLFTFDVDVGGSKA